LGTFAGDALKGVDATNPYIKLVRAELLDCLGVPICHLGLLSKLERAPLSVLGQFHHSSGQDKVASSEDKRSNCN
jgi:hypothetical protein